MAPATTMNDKRHTVLITGATSGLGLALARRLFDASQRLFLVGRQPFETLDLAGFDRHDYCRTDLVAPAAADAIARFLTERGVDRLDLLIHNAALGWYGPLEEQSEASVRELLAVNLWAPLALTHRLLPLILGAGGKVVVISSIAAALPAPEYAAYAASKAALEAWARSLRSEIHPTAQVQVIRPGPTRTGLHEKLGIPPERAPTYRFADPDEAAARIVRALRGRRSAVTIGPGNRMAHTTGWFLPRGIDGLLRRRRLRADRRNRCLVDGTEADKGRAPRPAWDRSAHSSCAPQARSPAALRNHCVITGSSAGIGRALAKEFLNQGMLVTGIDRVPQPAGEYDSAASVPTHLADLADLAALGRAVDALRAGPAIDLLIHNAGVNHVAPFGRSDLAEQRQVLAVNLLAPMLLTATLLRAGKLADGGMIVFIASLSHFTGYPGASVYAATKDGLVSYARSLSLALAPRNIGVLTVFPGPTRTAHARRHSPDNRREHRRMAPDRLARLIARAVQRRQGRLVPGWSNRLFAFAGRCFPRWTEGVLRRAILDRIESPPGYAASRAEPALREHEDNAP